LSAISASGNPIFAIQSRRHSTKRINNGEQSMTLYNDSKHSVSHIAHWPRDWYAKETVLAVNKEKSTEIKKKRTKKRKSKR